MTDYNFECHKVGHWCEQDVNGHIVEYYTTDGPVITPVITPVDNDIAIAHLVILAFCATFVAALVWIVIKEWWKARKHPFISYAEHNQFRITPDFRAPKDWK